MALFTVAAVGILLICAGLNFVVEGDGKSSADLPGHMQPLGSHRPMEGDIERLDRIPDPVTFYEEYVQKRRPFVLEGAVKDTVPVKMWTDDYLKTLFGDESVATEMSKKEKRGGPGDMMALAEFIERYNDELIYVVDQVPKGMRDQIQLPGCLSCGKFLDNANTVYMWFSSGGTKSVLHTDSFHNMHCLVAGEKRFVMIPPEYTTVIGPEWRGQGYYNLDVEAVNMTAYPNMVDVPWYRAVLQPGDCMFLPFNWIHQVHSLGRNFGINLWWVPFSLSYQDCQENRDRPSLVSLKDLPLKEYLTLKVPFIELARDDGLVYADDIYSAFEGKSKEGAVTLELILEMFELMKPGCKGVLEASYVLEMNEDAMQAVYEKVTALKNQHDQGQNFGEGLLEDWPEEDPHSPPPLHEHHEEL